MSKYLDEDRPYGRTIGDPKVLFKQDGMDFDSRKKVIPGSLNSGAPKVVETSPEVPHPVYEDMHIQALKREIKLCYVRLEAAGVDYDEVKAGSGLNKRLIGFLNENS